MLSVAKLTLGQEAYYEQQVAVGLDDYYAGRGESPGVWAGQGAATLRLTGVVGEGQLGTLLRGVDPASETALRSPVRERTITVRALDVETGEWREESRRLAPVSGYDLVFSCPKSVSLLHALTDDERVRRSISEAHQAALQAALGYLEREACVVRRGHGGAIREHGEGFVVAAFRHRMSRAQDPHLHTHVIVANLTRTGDGEWRALDGEAVLRTYRLAAGYLYEAQLRYELVQRLGLRWTEPVKGMAELEQVPVECVRAFSTRRQAVLEHMRLLGTAGFAAARVAALATREAKEQVDLPRLVLDWQARAAEHGLGARELRALVRDRGRVPSLLDPERLAVRLFAADGMTARQTSFTVPELIRAVADSLPEGASVEQLLEAADELSRFPSVELVEPGAVPGRPARFTTRELLEVEREALDLALAGGGVGGPRADETIVERTLAETALSSEQRALVREAALGADRVVCVVGAAGAGKTTALRALSAVCREAGVPVLGAAPSGRAADELEGATGIRSSTLHRLLLDTEGEHGLPHGCVLVVDEAGMAETRALAPLLRLVDEAEGKAVLVGDPAQLPAVGAGGLYAALCDRLGAVELVENRRQRDPAERRALARLRAGDPEPYLTHAALRGRFAQHDDPNAARRHLLEDWWQAAARDLAGTAMLAHRRDDVRTLNRAAHTLMLDASRLGSEAVDVAGHEFRVGDRVLCRRNNARLGLRNGTRATVTELDVTAGTLTIRTDSGCVRSLPPVYAAEHLEYGYALTGHAAQGATVERAFVLARGEGALQEWGYVACSRARGETRIYLTEGAHERETHGHEPRRSELSERFARVLSLSAAEPLALEQARTPSAATTRLLDRRRQQLDQQRRRAEQRLSAAEAELESLGWHGRRRHGAELRAEIVLQQTALRLADEKQVELKPGRTPQPPPPPAREGRELTRTRSPRLPVRRQSPGLELEL